MALRTKKDHAVRGGHQEGAVALEFAFSLLPTVFAMMFFIGMGYTIGMKQHAVVAARYTTRSYVVSRSGDKYKVPAKEEISDAAFTKDIEMFTTVERKPEDVLSSSPNEKNPEKGIDLGGVLDDAIGAFTDVVGKIAGKQIAGYRASSNPNRGLLPRVYTIGPAQGQYFLPTGTWTCKEMNTSGYLSLLLSEASSLLGADPWVCCTTYDGR